MKKSLLLLLALAAAACGGNNRGSVSETDRDEHADTIVHAPVDTLDLRIYVAADRAGVDHFGGRDVYEERLGHLFENINRLWNGWHTAGVKNNFDRYYRYFPDLLEKLFPEKMAVGVVAQRDGTPVPGATVRLYGGRAGVFNNSVLVAGRDIATPARRVAKAGDDGKYTFTGIPELYCPPPHDRPAGLPWGKFFNMLVEAEYGWVKGYAWVPGYEIQNTFFSNGDKETYEVTILLPPA